jgi:hypothetical protein
MQPHVGGRWESRGEQRRKVEIVWLFSYPLLGCPQRSSLVAALSFNGKEQVMMVG